MSCHIILPLKWCKGADIRLPSREIAKATEGRGAVKTEAWAARSRHVCAHAVARGGFYAVGWEARKSLHRGFSAPLKSIPNSLLAIHLYDVEAQCSAHLLQTIRRGSLRTAGASMRPLSHETGARKEEQWQQTNKTTSRSFSLS